MKTFRILTLLLFFIALISCENEKVEIPDVNSETIVNPELYEEPDDFKTIIEAKVIGDILEVTIGASGCDGSTWEVQLIDKGTVAESYPVQRFAKIMLINKEDCRAYFTRIFTFDLKPLRVKGENKVSINLDGWNKSLLYIY